LPIIAGIKAAYICVIDNYNRISSLWKSYQLSNL